MKKVILLWLLLLFVVSACETSSLVYNVASNTANDMECRSDRDCGVGKECRSRRVGGGTECRLRGEEPNIGGKTAPSTPSPSQPRINNSSTEMECNSYRDCEVGKECRSRLNGGGTECRARDEEPGAVRRTTPIKPSPSQPKISEPGEGGLKVISSGSAIGIAKGSFITNFHVVNDCKGVDIDNKSGRVIGLDAENDLALIEAKIDNRPVRLASSRPALGEQIMVSGYPLPFVLSGLNVTTGVVSALSGIRGDSRFIQITAPVQAGNSGGPLLNQSANLLGVVVSKLDASKIFNKYGDFPQNVNFAINVNVLRIFLDAQSVSYEMAGTVPALSAKEVAQRARESTHRVRCLG